MFTRKSPLLIVVMAILLTACTGGPEMAAREFVEASMTGDGAAALNLTCDQYKEQVQMVGFLAAGIGMLAGIDPQDAEADLSDLDFETVSEDGNMATVNVSGEIMLSLLGAAMPQMVDANIVMIMEDGEWRFCGDEFTSPTVSQVEVDLEATIAAGIAATQAAFAEEESRQAVPTVAQEPTVEPTMESIETAAPIEPAEPETTPTPSATRADTNPPLALPFADNFDQGPSPEWRIINGRPLVSNGRLTSAVDELSLEIGNTMLADYTLTVSVSGDDSCSTGSWNYLDLGFSPTLRMTYTNGGLYGRLTWWTLNDDEWSEIDEQDRLDCGRFEVAVFGNSYQVRLNGTVVSELVFEPASGPLVLGIDEGVYIDDLEIR